MICMSDRLSYTWKLDLSVVPKGYLRQILGVEKEENASIVVTPE